MPYSKKIFQIFFDAISNEISVEKDILYRLNKTHLSFTPIRAIKSIKLIEKYKVNKFIYSCLCILFVILSPLYFFWKLVKTIKFTHKGSSQSISQVVLVANGRIDYLFKKICIDDNVTFININQGNKNDYINLNSSLTFKDYIKAYIYSLYSLLFLLFKLKNKTDIMQGYVSYDWFLVFIALYKIRKKVKTVYFANHYDRWSVMFDQLFYDKEIVQMQHGILPNNLNLAYKLKNIDIIYCYNEKSKELFKKIFNLEGTVFKKINLCLKLSDVTSDKKKILIIGQPHSMVKEVEISNILGNMYDVFIKPHPLYSSDIYKSIENAKIINDSKFYPKVDLALCYESTLGLEYEASGINVLWWKNINSSQVVNEINTILSTMPLKN